MILVRGTYDSEDSSTVLLAEIFFDFRINVFYVHALLPCIEREIKSSLIFPICVN